MGNRNGMRIILHKSAMLVVVGYAHLEFDWFLFQLKKILSASISIGKPLGKDVCKTDRGLAWLAQNQRKNHGANTSHPQKSPESQPCQTSSYITLTYPGKVSASFTFHMESSSSSELLTRLSKTGSLGLLGL